MRFRVLCAVLATSLALVGCSRPEPDAPPAASGPASGAASPSASGAARPVGEAPTRTFPVGTRTDTWTRDGRKLRTTTWYPKASGQFPVVLFSHGLNGDPEDFEPLLSRWAAAGFVVVAPRYPKTSRNADDFDIADVLNQPADASFVLTKTLAGELSDSIEPGRVAAAGHSAGAITTVGLFTSGRDERLSAGIVLAGAAIGVGSSFTGAAAPLLFVHGDQDELVSYASGKAVFDAAPWPKAFLTLPGLGHGPPYLNSSSKGYKTVSTSTVDFLRYALYGDAAARGRLGADAKAAGTLEDRL